MKKKYYKFSLDLVIANIASLIPIVLAFVIMILLPNTITEKLNMNSLEFLMPLFLVYFILHELLHGIGYGFFAKDKKNTIKYGAKLESGVFYAMCQEKINKKGILISLALPTIVLTILATPIALLLKSGLLMILSIANLSGAVGDIIMMLAILRMPSDIEYIDYDNSIGAYLLSKEDLSKKKYFGFKFVESGKDSQDLINKNIKKLTVTKTSWIIMIGILLLSIIDIIVTYL